MSAARSRNRPRLVSSLLLTACGALGLAMATIVETRAAFSDWYCYSLRFARAEAPTGFLEFVGADGQFNGELFPEGSTVVQSHGAFFHLFYRSSPGDLGYETPGRLALDVPLDDADGNGIFDLLEVDRALPETTTTGTATAAGRPAAPVRATWQRAAGQRTGRCVLTLSGMRLLGVTVTETYAFAFEVLHYRSPLPFTAEGSAVTAASDLRQLDAPALKLTGTLDLTRKDAATLGCSNGALTNQDNQSLAFLVFDDFLWSGSAYVGVVVFEDFLPTTSPTDYRFWIAALSEPSDDDGDGVSDLADSDWQGVSTPPRPRLALVRSSGALHLSVTGTPGQAVRLQHTPALDPASWESLDPFLVGRETVVRDLGPAARAAAFWRLVQD